MTAMTIFSAHPTSAPHAHSGLSQNNKNSSLNLKNSLKSLKTLAVFCALLLGYNQTALAQSCTAAAPVVNFGTLAVQPTVQTDTTSNITLVCSGKGRKNITVRACISFKPGSAGLTLASRQMLFGGNALTYNLYKDPARTQIWGDTNSAQTPRTVDVYIAKGNVTTSVPIYGRLNSGQSGKPAGTYVSNFSGGNAAIVRTVTTLDNCTTQTGAGNTFTFTAQTAINATCGVVATTMNFGQVGRLNTILNSTSSISVSCPAGLPYNVALNGGQVSGNINARALGVGGSAPSVVNYQLYQDVSRTQVWGNGITGATLAGTGSGSAQTLTVFGQVPVQTTPPDNIYSDTITATVNF